MVDLNYRRFAEIEENWKIKKAAEIDEKVRQLNEETDEAIFVY